tara:strand:+ start:2395 stop:3291 length:897 start_codon:yes stop_codon:yes gene_type:complete
MPQIFKVDKNYHNSRFDKWFKSNVAKIPQSLIQKLIRKNKIKVNKKKTLTSYRVQSGDLIEIYQKSEFKINDIKKNKYLPSKKEASKYDDFIIENNENFVVLNKPSGIAVQGGTKSFKNIIDIIKKSQAFENCIPYIVHRIDKDTSGLLLIAKNRKYAQLLTSLFRIRRIHKTYLAITHGVFPNKIDKLVDNLLIFEKNKKIIQKAITKVKVLKTHKNYSLLELKPITGRKHQLRKQLHLIGYPIVGDKKYYNIKKKNHYTDGLMLHAYKIKFMINDIKYNFEASFDSKIKNFLKLKL